MREWVIYAVFMSLVFALFFQDRGLAGALSGLLVSGPLYLGLGALLAKLGLQRKSISQVRKERAAASKQAGNSPSTSSEGGSQTSPRPRPAPTRRTAGQRPHSRSTRRR
jgi:hypothetical protein